MASEKLVRFLLVEDDDDHAFLVKRALSTGRIMNKLDHVKDGEEAIQFLKKEDGFEDSERPDVVILDLNLPKKSGLEVLKEIREDGKLRRLPVVILTTSDAERDRIAAYDDHVNSYLQKPIDSEQFRRMIDDLSLYWGVWNQPPPTDEE